ncbi:MAG: ABC transporter substrate-binding protein [Candidatus Rokubacteria bacterium]|nr:ABC transporter substrate-binding protein [Candidatus Rokubacteria bacterium]
MSANTIAAGPGRAIGAVLALLLGLLVVIPPAAFPERRGGAFRGVFGADPPTLDPAQATDTTSSAVIRQLFDTLVELDDRLTPVPALAQRWTVSRDQRVYTFHLRAGVKFHHGRELRAGDVKYSYERAARGKRPWVFEKIAGARDFIRSEAREIRGIRVADDLTVEVTLERPFAPFLYLVAYDAAAIVPREEAERRGVEFASHPVGTGAFRLVSWRRDDQVVLEAFREHFRGAPYLHRIVFRIIPAEITRFNEYRTGHLDVADIPTGHCRAVQRDPAFKGEVAIWPILGTHAVRFNVERAPFGDRRVRQALAHAIDPGPIVHGLLEGCVTPGKGILPPAMPGFNPNVAGLPFDRERARQLLAAAGYAGGKGLGPVAYHYNTGDLNQRIAELLQAQLKEVGITLELRRLDWAAHIKLVDEGATPFFRQGWIADYPDPENFLAVLFHSRNAGAAGNTSRYRNPVLDRLFDEADAMAPGPLRFKRYQEAEQMILTDAAWITLYHYSSRALIKPYVKGLERSPLSSAPEFLAPFRKVWLDR